MWLQVVAPGAPPTLRLYCHRSEHSRTFLAINLGRESVELVLNSLAKVCPPHPLGTPNRRKWCHQHLDERCLGTRLWLADTPSPTRQVWTLDAPALDAPFVTLNGIQPCVLPDGTVPELPGQYIEHPIVPPGAALFAQLPL